MRTKLFRAFFIIILIALLSNFIFRWLIVKDFDRYVESVKEDQFRWIVASLESGYRNGRWDPHILSESLHWAMMLGIEARIVDAQGNEVLSSEKAMTTLSEAMRHEMTDLFHLEHRGGEYLEHPLVVENKMVATLLFRPFPKKEIKEKEKAFKNKAGYFLYISFLIAGAGASVLALLLSKYLSEPLSRLKEGARRIAHGDMGTRIKITADRRSQTRSRRFLWKTNRPDDIDSLAQSFNSMAETLQKEENLRKNLLSNITHELRTPLTIMKQHLEALEDGVLDDEEAALKVIRSETEKLIALIGGIEDLTMAEASFLKKSESAAVNLREFLEDLVNDLIPLTRGKVITLEVMRDKDMVVTTDIEKLEKIVRNLVSNSLKFTREGAIRLDYGAKEHTFFVEIKDTGKGIPEDRLPLIFNRFYRGEKSPAAGLGLGLAIVNELVAALGGRIEVRSKVGQGTAFRVYLPLNSSLQSS